MRVSDERDEGAEQAQGAQDSAQRAEKWAIAAEEANKRANSEALFAFNAKKTCEEHSTAIARLKGNAEVDAGAISGIKTSAEKAQSDAEHAKHSAETDARAAAESRAAADRASTACGKAQERLEAASGSAETRSSEAKSAADRAAVDAAAIASARATADAALAAAQTSQTGCAESAATAKAEATAATKSATDAKQKFSEIKDLVDRAQTTETSVVKYEADLTRLHGDMETLHKKIEGLLPNATSAGLASAFRNQQARFDRPQKLWLGTFVASLVVLCIVGAKGIGNLVFGSDVGQPETWDAIMRHFVSRLPLVIPLVWLAIYAGRNYTIALRLQEEYAFKEALSTAFEGYKREMANIADSDPANPSALGVLCRNILGVLDQRSGRIYEGTHDDVTPISTLAKALTDALEKLKPSVIPGAKP